MTCDRVNLDASVSIVMFSFSLIIGVGGVLPF